MIEVGGGEFNVGYGLSPRWIRPDGDAFLIGYDSVAVALADGTVRGLGRDGSVRWVVRFWDAMATAYEVLP